MYIYIYTRIYVYTTNITIDITVMGIDHIDLCIKYHFLTTYYP